MQLFRNYVISSKKTWLLLLMFFLVSFFSFLLFQLPIVVLLYSTILCLVIFSVYTAWDYYSFRQRHLQLAKMSESKAFDVTLLPEAMTTLENDYQLLLSRLITEKNKQETKERTRYADMIQYYTIWVHQIKTPIASMRLILQEQDSEFSRELKLELLEIEQYVEMVLCYLRLDSDSTDYVIREYDLNTIIQQEIKKLAPQFIHKNLRLEYDFLDTTVLTDEKWLSFVIGQVLSNAVKYTKEGSIQITLKSPKLLCIQDTGIGIASEDLPRVFENGFTGFNGRTDKKASGIGLYLCKRICDNLGHKITIASTIDKGTTVSIDLEHKNIDSPSMPFSQAFP